MPTKPTVLMISKPIVPPWNDSAKNIVKDQVTLGQGYRYRILTTENPPPLDGDVIAEPLYSDAGTFAAGIRQNLKVMLRGMRSGDASIHHYFFAPNPLTSHAGRLQTLTARVKTVQTICSAPASFEKASRLIYTDAVITVSRNTRDKLAAAGVPKEKLFHIPPGIPPLSPLSAKEKTAQKKAQGLDDSPMVLFPGDFEFSSAAETVASSAEDILKDSPEATLVFGCRIKRPPSLAIQDRIKSKLSFLGDRVRFINHVEDMPRFAGAADVVIMPAESLYAKMDMPLVLLEAMSQKVPLVLADCSPLDELIETGCADAVPPGDPESLTRAVSKILNNEDHGRALGEAGAAAVETTFSASSMTEKVEALYDELLR